MREPFRTPPQKPVTKTKINKKRLAFIFFSTFAVFFLLCSLVASIFTPSINISTQNQQGQTSNVSASDMPRNRIDPRLKSIEMQENVAPPVFGTGNTSVNVNQKNKNNLQNKNPQIQENSTNYNELPYDNGNPDAVMPDAGTQPQDSEPQYSQDNPPRPPAPTAENKTKAPSPSGQENSLNLRDKINLE